MKKKKTKSYLMILILMAQLMPITFYLPFKNPLPSALIINTLVCFLLPSLMICIMEKKEKFKTVIKLNPLSFKNIIYIVILTVTMIPLLNTAAMISSLFFKNRISATANALTDLGFFQMLLPLAVFPAIFEEIAFRGVLFDDYKAQPLFKLCLINGLFFGLVHLNLQQFFYAFISGCIFTIFVYYTNSILSSMLSHFLINSISTIITYFVANGRVIETNIPKNVFISVFTTVLICLIGSTLFILTIKKFVKYNKSLNPSHPSSENSPLDINDDDFTDINISEENSEPTYSTSKGIIEPLFVSTVVIYLIFVFSYSFM